MKLNEIIKNAEERKALAYSNLQGTEQTLNCLCQYYMNTHNAFCELLSDLKQLSIASSDRVRKQDLIDFLKWFQIRIDKSICENEEEIIELYLNQLNSLGSKAIES